jgi:hypothetical protein
MVERSAIVFNDSRRDEDTSVEVGQHPLGSGLGTVHGDDSEVLRADGLYPGGENAAGFTKVAALARTTSRTIAARKCTHGRFSSKELVVIPTPHRCPADLRFSKKKQEILISQRKVSQISPTARNRRTSKRIPANRKWRREEIRVQEPVD